MGRFQKGHSGNPGGRPKAIAGQQALAREYTMEAIEALARIAKDDDAPPAARVAAARELLDRGWGRAPLAASVPVAFGGRIAPSLAEMLAVPSRVASESGPSGLPRLKDENRRPDPCSAASGAS